MYNILNYEKKTKKNMDWHRIGTRNIEFIQQILQSESQDRDKVFFYPSKDLRIITKTCLIDQGK